ncbi:PIN-like domain-containing protein [Sphingomonas sp.]|uniref:PIN-like domain-containing protein n=1 Tax=Sphingomonas sp. TaxID=28214 RepID=UPI002DD694BF|nr:PIN-like domain-containing protein [Sphingomonas sp.]
MRLPEIAPSRSECQRQIVEALNSAKVRLFVDASVLIHCYEMSRSACEELLNALEGLGDRVRVPIWAAKETWEHTRALPSRQPLRKVSGSVTKAIAQFRTDSLRFVDARTFEDMTADQFTAEVDSLVAAADALTRRTERFEPAHDYANARLLPFIADHSPSSDMPAIYDEVSRTGEQRYAHEVPPGFKDGGTKEPAPEDQAEGSTAQLKGKKRNRFGDLIMWLEALQDCEAGESEHLIVLTRDNTKKDWVYNPERVTDDDDRLTQNGGVVTLPLPLLAQEAHRRCPTLQSVHVISLEMFTQVLRSNFGGRVSNLIRALQPGAAARRPTRPAERPDRAPAGGAAAANVTFSSADMLFEPTEEQAATPIWQAIAGLRAEGWTAQNEAATALTALLPEAGPEEAKQIGRGIVAASNEDALGPLELAEEVLADPEASAEVRANLLVGMLAETYYSEEGEAKKPRAHPEITASLFAHAADADTRQAYTAAVGVPLEPLRRAYLALPEEDPRTLRVEIQLADNTLQGLQIEGREVLEQDAPGSRQIVTGGRAAMMPVTELLKAVAAEFVVPFDMLAVDGPTSYDVEIPERFGFVGWGPETGEQLR